jgi:hypothetical protein
MKLRLVTASRLEGYVLPDLAFGYIYIFEPFQQHLTSKRFTRVADMEEEVTSWLQAFDTDTFYAGKQTLVAV